jgi:hypothetical protein
MTRAKGVEVFRTCWLSRSSPHFPAIPSPHLRLHHFIPVEIIAFQGVGV